ncbi:MAG: ACP S-malonyltransferase [Candidatus Levybacteria bacterium]|nr:ACP S-malonyltransferase [Candidatus Levybacteria bacterium]MBI2622807.1 ACP S-malonyltransferase [Candidatus Levybacteria bacterium]MBI3070013.1 ACP S-malonyltransferase [Candidatus Levybacteria bacterium]MBI3092871.1 ACP S-malonyltransferase [Candidatus Levybacteria bacterium]
MRSPAEAGISVEGERRPGKIAFVFPGQGTQHAGMGREIYEHYPVAKRVFDMASQLLRFDIARLCFEGPEKELSKTIHAQPAIVVNSLAAYAAVQEVNSHLEPDFVAGHSLGQLSAAAVAGSIRFEDAICLAGERGRITQEHISEALGGMAAFLGASLEAIEEICRRTGTFLANHNGPGQIVISGLTENLEKAKDLAREYGVRRIIPLAIGGPFHSPYMADAETEFKKAVDRIKVADPDIPFVSNERGFVCLLGEEVRRSIAGGLTGPVKWRESMQGIIDEGVNVMYEFGGSLDGVLTGILRKINPQVKGFIVNNLQSLRQVSA